MEFRYKGKKISQITNFLYDFLIPNWGIKGLHVLFQPEVKTDSSGLRQKTFISGCSVQEAPKNDVDTSKPKENSGTGTGD